MQVRNSNCAAYWRNRIKQLKQERRAIYNQFHTLTSYYADLRHAQSRWGDCIMNCEKVREMQGSDFLRIP